MLLLSGRQSVQLMFGRSQCSPRALRCQKVAAKSMRRKPPVRYTTRVLGLFRVKGQGLALSLCRELDSQTAC